MMLINHLEFLKKNPLLYVIANQLCEIIVILDDKFNVVLLNEPAEKLFHTTLLESHGYPFRELCYKAKIASFISKDMNNERSSKEITTIINNLEIRWKTLSLETPDGLFHLIKTVNFADSENKNEIFQLKTLIENMPCNVYWVDKNCLMLGCNNNVLTMLNMTTDQFRGKSYEELSFLCNWPIGLADKLKNDDLTVLKTKYAIYGIEDPPIPGPNNTEFNFLTTRVPLHNKNGEIIGVAGISTDITTLKRAREEAENSLMSMKKAQLKERKYRKENEHVKLENLAKKLEAQTQITKIANQVAHDIRSPLASLLMILNSCTELSEEKRVSLRDASIRIGDIANNLLNQYTTSHPTETHETKQPVLVSATLLQLLTEKRFQYQGLPLKLDTRFSEKSQFAFIETSLSSFQRMVSNLINNAVEALENKPGTVTLTLDATQKQLHLKIKDTGKGITPALLKKIKQKIAITAGKKNGHGIGLGQVQETLETSNGTMNITSELGKGSCFCLSFPRSKAPRWCAEDIVLNSEDIILILDDDHSIHSAWDIRFNPLLESSPQLRIHHFEQGDALLKFISNLPKEDGTRTILLTDYELLGQKMNGLQIVNNTRIQRSILVTSHYLNSDIQMEAIRLNTKILPKQLASEITIKINTESNNLKTKNHVQAIFVDDDELFIHTLSLYLFNDADNIIHFNHPEALKKQLALYPKETLIYLDNHYPSGISGLEFADWLYQQGYTKLYLLSGHLFPPGDLPPYLTPILKTDIHRIKQW